MVLPVGARYSCLRNPPNLATKGPPLSVLRSVSIAVATIALFAFPGKTPAQIAVYGTGSLTSFGFSGDAYPNSPSFKPRNTGFTAGFFRTIPNTNFGRFKPGFDARVTFAPGYNGGKAYTGGIRFSYVPYRFPLRPYAEFGGGMVATQLNQSVCSGGTCTTTTQQIHGGGVMLDAGLDVHLIHGFDLRAIDFGTTEGGTRGLTSADVKFYSAGLVYRFGRARVTAR